MKFKRLVSFLLVAVMVAGLGISPISVTRAYAHIGNGGMPEAQIEEPQPVPVEGLEHEAIEGYIVRHEELPLYAELLPSIDEFAYAAGVGLFPELRALAAILAAGGIYFTSTGHMYQALSNFYFVVLDDTGRSLVDYYAHNFVYVDDTSTRAIRTTAEALLPIRASGTVLFGLTNIAQAKKNRQAV